MNIGEAENWVQQQLETVYKGTEKGSVTNLVMEHVTNEPRPKRLVKKKEPLSESKLIELQKIIEKLKNNQPVQYVFGHAWFWNLKLYVDNSVLIPRPETEELVEWIITDLKKITAPFTEKSENSADKTDECKILDVGTGSGAIALALKKALPLAEVWGCDVSEKALNVARRNGSENDIRVDFQGIDFLNEDEQSLLPTVHIVVSNPPYVPQKDSTTMQTNVVDFEPHLALFVPDDNPLIFYKALAQFGKKRLYSGGAIYAEIHEDLGSEVVELFNAEGYQQVTLKKDMQGKNRMVKATTPF